MRRLFTLAETSLTSAGGNLRSCFGLLLRGGQYDLHGGGEGTTPHTAFDDLEPGRKPWFGRLKGLLQLRLIGRVADPAVTCLSDCWIKLVLQRLAANNVDRDGF
jgi:hypothetical protein